MWQQVIRVGNSAAVTIPKDFLKQVKINIGDKVLVEADIPSKILMVRLQKENRIQKLNPELVEWSDKFIKKYNSLLKELAER